MWAAWGKSETGTVTLPDFLGPRGLLKQLQENMQGRLAADAPPPKEETPCPDLHLDKRGWFQHWDEDKSGVLERSEVVRGLAKNFKSDVPAEVCKKRLRMR